LLIKLFRLVATQLWQSLGEPTKFSSAQEADAQISTLQRMIREMNEFDARITQLISAPKMNMRERFTLRILRYCNNVGAALCIIPIPICIGILGRAVGSGMGLKAWLLSADCAGCAWIDVVNERGGQ
jgi:hypothetical protein